LHFKTTKNIIFLLKWSSLLVDIVSKSSKRDRRFKTDINFEDKTNVVELKGKKSWTKKKNSKYGGKERCDMSLAQLIPNIDPGPQLYLSATRSNLINY
jgi:hypothetical protein